MRSRRLVLKAVATFILGFGIMAVAGAQSGRASSTNACRYVCHWNCPTKTQQDADCENLCPGSHSTGCGSTPCPYGPRDHTHFCVLPDPR